MGWNDELARRACAGLQRRRSRRRSPRIWAGWASEIAADAFAFVHTGFASVAALHDVLAGDPAQVFRSSPGDPHPISYLRVLLGVEMCRYFYGDGPVGHAGAVVDRRCTRLERRPAEARAIAEDSLPLLDAVVRLTLDTPMRAFQGPRAARARACPSA